MLVLTDDLLKSLSSLVHSFITEKPVSKVFALSFFFFQRFRFYQGFSVFPTVSNDVFGKNAF